MKSKAYVALSGGVDSAVAVALLQNAGHAVVGVFMREYDLDLAFPFAEEVQCTQTGDRQSALAVAVHLGIPFMEWDFRCAYKRDVVRYLVREYRAGRTPNPDIMCNQKIKFGRFLDRARREGADFIATGHYARIGNSQRNNKKNFRLLNAKDTNKDQTYFLYTLTQGQLKYTQFPIGEYTKPEVRTLAKKMGLPNWDRKDSQGVCFIGKLPMKEFLKTQVRPTPGHLRTLDGRDIGTHEGAWYYTIGQRHGIGFGGGEKKYYVVRKDIKKNIVYVAQGDAQQPLHKKKVNYSAAHWVSGKSPKFPFLCKARIRYRQALGAATVYSSTMVEFKRAQRAVAPGQAIVFYKGKECLGGGTIQ
ncbi:tRNA 2-thiouridine(34) synthase MnmA [Candidatus Uhrbacteria bacterium]|nr:tRNA 2-thiouridine(34) synthase MnmA [Candidatus Uhrbacteria bacterium]